MDETTESEQELEQRRISEKLVADFSFKSDGFSDPIPWINGIGFSRIKKLPDDNASLFKLGMGADQLQLPSSRKKLWISESYGKEEMGGITFGEKRKISDPVDIDFRDEFTYDTASDKYYHGEKEITPEELLKVVDQDHTRPTKAFRGIWVRCRLWFWRILLPTLITWLDILLVWLLWLISGEAVKDDIIRRLVGTRPWGIKSNEPISSVTEFEESKKMDFFGYKAKRWSVVFYCTFQLVLFAIGHYYKIHPVWAITILKSDFLALCYVVVTFAVTEALIPQILKSIITKITPTAFGIIAFKRLKI